MPYPLPPRERITQHVIVDPVTDCWLWQGAKIRGRYGVVGVNYKKMLAHRQSYLDFVGPIPDGMHLDHLCGNPSCVNPLHLEPVTQAENNARAGALGRMDRRSMNTHCKHGHEYTLKNTRITKEGWRECRVCFAAKARRKAARKRAQLNPSAAPSLTVRAK